MRFRFQNMPKWAIHCNKENKPLWVNREPPGQSWKRVSRDEEPYKPTLYLEEVPPLREPKKVGPHPDGDGKALDPNTKPPDPVTPNKAAPPPETPATPGRPIVLGGPDDCPIVRGIEKDILTPTQYRVVKTLLDAFPGRVAGDTLAGKSDTEDPVAVIDRLSRDKDWASVLSKPGKPHGGYGIVSTPRKTQKNRETRPRKPRG